MCSIELDYPDDQDLNPTQSHSHHHLLVNYEFHKHTTEHLDPIPKQQNLTLCYTQEACVPNPSLGAILMAGWVQHFIWSYWRKMCLPDQPRSCTWGTLRCSNMTRSKTQGQVNLSPGDSGVAISVLWPQYHWATLGRSQTCTSFKTAQEFTGTGGILPGRMGSSFTIWKKNTF